MRGRSPDGDQQRCGPCASLRPESSSYAAGARPAPSGRERDLLRLVAAGSSNEEAATHLALGPKTIESQLRRMFMRYGVRSRTELIAVAREEGWLLGGSERA